MRPSSPRSSRISSTTARYSRASSWVCSSSGWPSWTSCTSIRSASPLAGDRGAPARPRCRPTTVATGRAAARAAALDHLGDDADAAELAVGAGQQEDALLLAGVDRQRRGDGGENDRFVERNQEIGHV